MLLILFMQNTFPNYFLAVDLFPHQYFLFLILFSLLSHDSSNSVYVCMETPVSGDKAHLLQASSPAGFLDTLFLLPHVFGKMLLFLVP